MMSRILWSLLALLSAGIVAAVLTTVLRPLLVRYALARPNARSSHLSPTPQGAGIAIVVALLAVSGFVIGFVFQEPIPLPLFGATLVIAAVGAVDDIHSIPVLPRLLLQGICAAAIVLTRAGEPQIVPYLPIWIEFTLLFVGTLWFVNLVNFMDGLDLMTVAEVVPVALALTILSCLDLLPLSVNIVAAALAGAMLGFAPFNRPVAKVFLGDVGSLSIGLVLAWCLIDLAHLNIAAALLLPLYYLADTTITLFKRIARREPFLAAHRTHFYQLATTNGLSVTSVVKRVFILNVVLAVLAILAATNASPAVGVIALCVGAIAVAVMLTRFAAKRQIAS